MSQPEVNNVIRDKYKLLLSGETLPDGDVRNVLTFWHKKLCNRNVKETVLDYIVIPAMRLGTGHLNNTQRMEVITQWVQDLSALQNQGDLYYDCITSSSVKKVQVAWSTAIHELTKRYQGRRAILDQLRQINHLATFRLHVFGYNVMINNQKEIDAYFEKNATLAIEAEDNGEKKRYDILLLVLAVFQQYGYRRSGHSVMKPVKNAEGQETGCFEYHAGIEETIHQHINTKENVSLHQLIYNHRSKSELIDELLKGENYQFPLCRPCRYVFAYEDGIFNASDCSFVKWDEGALEKYDVNHPCNFFKGIKYHEIDIETPYFDSIINYQLEKKHFEGYDDEDTARHEIISWIKALIGRCLFDVGHKDKWQIMLFFYGFAGTGKGLLMQIISRIYDRVHIGDMDENLDPKFGLTDLIGKFVALSFEIGLDFKLPMATFNSMVSGETVVVNTKNARHATSLKWTAPIVMAGNVLPNWRDLSDSLSRRIVPVMFMKPVRPEDCDPNLMTKLVAELGSFVIVVSRAYERCLEVVGDNGFWDECPQYFRDCNREVMASKKPLVAFIRSSGDVILNENDSVKLRAFENCYKAFCAHRKLRYVPSHEPSFASMLETCGCQIIKKTETHHNELGQNRTLDVDYVQGCCLVQEDDFIRGNF